MNTTIISIVVVVLSAIFCFAVAPYWQYRKNKKKKKSEDSPIIVIRLTISNPVSNNQFSGPTDEQFYDLLQDRERLNLATYVHNNDLQNCKVCIIPTEFCLARSTSFNLDALNEAIATLTNK